MLNQTIVWLSELVAAKFYSVNDEECYDDGEETPLCP